MAEWRNTAFTWLLSTSLEKQSEASDKRVRFLTPEEERKLRDAVRSNPAWYHHEPELDLALNTGLRLHVSCPSVGKRRPGRSHNQNPHHQERRSADDPAKHSPRACDWPACRSESSRNC